VKDNTGVFEMRNSLLRSTIWISLFLGGCLLWGQTQFIPLNVNYAVFNGKDNNEYVEVYLSLQQRSLAYAKTASGFEAIFDAQCEIKSGETIFHNETRSFVNAIDSLREVHFQNQLHHIFLCTLPPGEYSAKISVTDVQSGARGEYLMDLGIPSLGDSTLAMSDIELADKISRGEENNKFYKNGFQIIPNASGVYSIGQPMLYYYAEVYNLPFSPDLPGTYTLESYITGKEGITVRTFPVKKKQKPGTSAVLVGGHNIVTLESDAYLFHLKFIDDQSRESIEHTKQFRMFKPSEEQLAQTDRVRAVTAQLMTSYYSKLSEEEMDEEFEKVKYIATNEEKDIYRDLNKEGKIEFLVEFWRNRDPDLSTPQNEFKINYFQMVDYSSTYFKTKFREGWKTDRGRVLLIYGQPDEIERSPSESGKKPYEIWSYNSLDGGSIFVFADLRGFGEYELLHSTYRKELNQPNWENLIEVQRDPNNALDFR
jgi:GWxTD domain-containing protein